MERVTELAPRFLFVYIIISLISHIGVLWYFIISNMEYRLCYTYEGKDYTVKEYLLLKVSGRL